MRQFLVSSFLVREYWGYEDELVIHMGVIVGMRGCLHQDATVEGGRLSW